MATPAADSGGARGIYRALWLCAALLILATAAWLYWPGIDGPALLDDKSSLGRLEQLVEQPDYLSELVAGERSGPLGRPLSVWSFALEKIYLGGASPTTKTINVLLHVFNGALVMYFCLLLLRAAGIPAYRSLAVIAGAAWLVSPLYISTVLYMVQRMAMLAATLVLLSCIGYLRWRVALSRGEWTWSWLLAALLFGLAAPFAKENGVLVLPLVICIELFWFGFRGEGGQVIGWLKHGTLASLTAMILLPLLFLVLNPGYFEAQFRSRDFTLWERLLTQSRVVWDYVAQHIWPEVARMGIVHDDVVVSTSLFAPSSTLTALLGWLALIAACAVLSTRAWGRRLVFPAAFFLVGHSLESTVFPLEMYFEHRNYLPGVGLFLGLAYLCGLMINRFPEIRGAAIAWLAGGVLLLSMQTSSQVQVWSSPELLRITQLNAHPESFRANIDAASMLAQVGDLEGALHYSARAHEVSLLHRSDKGEHSGDYDMRDLALSCMAGQPLSPERIRRIGSVDPRRPLSSVSTFYVVIQLAQNGACPELDWEAVADRLAYLYLESDPPATARANVYSALATLENSLQRYGRAYLYAEKYLAEVPESTTGLLMQLHFSTALGRKDEATALKSRLRRLDSVGKLTLKERDTLQLYEDI
jgi:hypothetical protein